MTRNFSKIISLFLHFLSSYFFMFSRQAVQIFNSGIISVCFLHIAHRLCEGFMLRASPSMLIITLVFVSIPSLVLKFLGKRTLPSASTSFSIPWSFFFIYSILKNKKCDNRSHRTEKCKPQLSRNKTKQRYFYTPKPWRNLHFYRKNSNGLVQGKKV